MDDIITMLKLMYAGFTDAELNTLVVAGQNADLDPLLREIMPMRDEDTGLFYPYAVSKSIVAEVQRYFTDRGATSWFDQRPITRPDEREALHIEPGEVVYEVRLSDTLAQVEYRNNFKQLADAGYPVDQLIEALGPCPRPTVTISTGRVLASEQFETRFRMSRADYAVKRGMRKVAELRMPTTGAARVGANLKRLSEIDMPAVPDDPLSFAGIAAESDPIPAPQPVHYENCARRLGRDDSDGLI
jgi:hypothetical protein